MENARTECNDHQVDDSNSGVQRTGDDREQARFGSSTDKCQEGSKEIEFKARRPAQEIAQLSRNGMDDDVEPAPDSKLRRVLPGLESVSMIEIMQGLPVIEHLIAILNGCISCSKDMRQQAQVESNIQRQIEPRRRCARLCFGGPK